MQVFIGSFGRNKSVKTYKVHQPTKTSLKSKLTQSLNLERKPIKWFESVIQNNLESIQKNSSSIEPIYENSSQYLIIKTSNI